MKALSNLVGLLVLLTWAGVVTQAAEETGAQYVYLQPAFTTNFGQSGRMGYIRTEIAVKVNSLEAAEKVRHHLPYLRHDIIVLLSAQEGDVVNTPKGRERLRHLALDQLRGRLIELEEEPVIEELYFSNFVVQN